MRLPGGRPTICGASARGVLLLSGDEGPAGGAPASDSPGPDEITASRAGVVQGTGTEARFRVDIYRVERYEQYSLLRFAITNLEDSAYLGSDLFSATRNGETFSAFELVDPVGRRLYRTLREGGAMQGAFGSTTGYSLDLEPGVRYRGVVYFPPLPEAAQRVTVLGPDTTGELTGVPVVRGAGPPTANSTPTSAPTQGQPATLPSTPPPSGDVWSRTEDLYAITDSSSTRSNVSSPGRQAVALRADVLFAFDSAELSDQAKGVIQEVAPEVTQRADPGEPVVVEGHTDDQGSDAYNEDLSERRAEAVHEELASALGGSSSLRFKVSGRHVVYYPAPPAGVEQVTFDAGPFGKVQNVPVR